MDASENTRTVPPDGEAIRRLRVERGWQVAELAKRAKCSLKTVENVERGKKVYSFTLRKFAEAFRVEPGTLLLNATTPPTPRRVKVHLTLEIPYEEFDESEQLVTLIKTLQAMLAVRHSFEVDGVGGGSTVVILEMDAEDAINLRRLFESGSLAQQKIVDVRFHEPQSDEGAHPQTVGIPESVEEDIRRLQELQSVRARLRQFAWRFVGSNPRLPEWCSADYLVDGTYSLLITALEGGGVTLQDELLDAWLRHAMLTFCRNELRRRATESAIAPDDIVSLDDAK